MHYFAVFFVIYALGIIFYTYLGYTYILIAAIISAIFNSILTKKHIFSLLIILFTILPFVTINYNSKSMLIQYLNSEIEIIASILSIRSNNEESRYIGYNAYVTDINGIKLKEKIVLYIPKDENIKLNSIVKARVKISDITGNRNRMLFNYKNYLRSEKIFVSAFCEGDVEVIAVDYSLINSVSYVCKEKIEKLFRRFMSDENANVILSVILGDTGYLDEGFYKDIQKTGLAHVFAVSGLHIAVIYTVFLKVLTFAGINRKIAWFLSWIILWFYGFLIGFPISVLRSLLMFNLLFGAELLYRKYSSVNSLALSALVLLVINPYYLFDAGFLLSYMAALCLIVYNQIVVQNFDINNSILNSIILYIFIQIFTLPLMSYYFNYISIIGIIFNILIVPLFSAIIVFSFAVIPISLIYSYIVMIPLKFLDFVLNSVNYLIVISAKLKFSGIEIASMGISQSIYYYIFIIMIIYLFKSINSKIKAEDFLKLKPFHHYFGINYKGFIFLSFCIFYIIDLILVPLSFNGLNLNIIDVGQGLFINLNYNKYNMVFDAGSDSESIGKYVVSPYLIKNGKTNIDSIFISHFHEDHYSGIDDIISNFDVKKIFSSSDRGKEYINSDYDILNSNHVVNVGNNIKIDLLWPDEGYSSSNENNMSNVYFIQYAKIKILITGDIEKEVEEKILPMLEKVDIVIVPHHGSKSSSSEEFINKIDPKIAVFSYGKNNYGIPSYDVIKRYERIGAKKLSTFDDGEINIMVIGDKIYYNTYTGNNSENLNEIYMFRFYLSFLSFCLFVFSACFYKKYIC